jgi:hypothetical protein
VDAAEEEVEVAAGAVAEVGVVVGTIAIAGTVVAAVGVVVGTIAIATGDERLVAARKGSLVFFLQRAAEGEGQKKKKEMSRGSDRNGCGDDKGIIVTSTMNDEPKLKMVCV